MSVAYEMEADLAAQMRALGAEAKLASRALANAGTETKNAALKAMATAIRGRVEPILEANVKDLKAAQSANLKASFIDRLTLTADRVEAMAKGLDDIAALPDPVGEAIAEWERPNGLKISRVRTPIGVIGVIFESRPNVTADAGALCMKAGNAAILRGGSDSYNSSGAILACLQEGLRSAGLPETVIQAVPTTDRAAVGMMLAGLDGAIDVIVPRGGKNLVGRVEAEARVPVFSHLEGICHVYIDKAADTQMAVDVTVNAKMRRTGICGAAETVLVDSSGAEQHLKAIIDGLIDAGCTIKGDEAVQFADARVEAASEEDWSTEYLDSIVSMALVDGIDEAMDHIRAHGSNHTEAIITDDEAKAERFPRELDSAIVLQNASTQYADGGEFGMGAEIGIATGKMHARGPVGVEQLTSFKYVVRGTGQTRAP